MLMDFLKNKMVKILLIFSLVWTFLDVIWDLFLSLLHSLAMLVHYAFEFFEHSLDLMVEHLFHTGPRETQIIVFYIMLAFGGVIAYLILRKLPDWYCSCCEKVRRYWYQESAKAKIFWESQSLALKAKWYTFAVTGSFFMYLLVLS
jgi:hypothetical protein